MLNQRLDLPFENKLKLWKDWLKCTANKCLKQGLEILFENKIETMDRLPKMHGQKLLETTVRFSI